MSTFQVKTGGKGIRAKRPSGTAGPDLKIPSKGPQKSLANLKAEEISPDKIIPLEEKKF